jgi:putative pyruvate formate lyase activating enzyme
MPQAVYLQTARDGELRKRVRRARNLLNPCAVCPRNCNVDRPAEQRGFCRIGQRAMVSSYGPHHGEETPLVGRGGSGTIFFTSCNLGCVFCQNFEISHELGGREVEAEELADTMVGLQRRGCHNINFVTPSHVVPQILEALEVAVVKGLTVPLVYNSGGYDSVETLRLLDGIVDIYMPDLKCMSPAFGEEYLNASNYPEIAKAAIREMHRQVGDLAIDEDGVAMRGLLVRHLVMPGGLADTDKAMAFLADEISRDTYVNVMDQYRPCGRAPEFQPIAASLTAQEYEEAVAAAKRAGVHRLDSRVGLRVLFRRNRGR